MNIREKNEKMEMEYLSLYAAKSCESMGRDREEAQCDIRTVYQRDRDRIIHCKAFRRLKHKTQVFLAPMGDHYRTRLTHTLEVSQIARTISKSLDLNEDLTEAIALGHDVGHTPFGHAGERTLNKVCSLGFAHAKQSIRVVEVLENNGLGLNLTKEVRDGILNHRTSGTPHTLEGKVVRLSDKIAYINHDIDDAIRGKIITENDIPKAYTEILGKSTKERLNTLVHDIVKNSYDKPDILMSQEIEEAMMGLRQYMFESVYTNPVAKIEEIKVKEISFYQINHHYSITNDLKLTAHSLIARYLEILIAQDDNIDTINTINLLLESFTNELDNELIYPKFITYTPKQFLKILLPIFLKEEDQANEYDLSYDEIILFQLKMIDYISKHQTTKIICLIELPYLSKEINDYLINMKNCFIVAMFYKTNSVLNIKDTYIFDDLIVDLNNDEQIYNIYLNKGVCTLQEAKEMIINNIKAKLDISITL